MGRGKVPEATFWITAMGRGKVPEATNRSRVA